MACDHGLPSVCRDQKGWLTVVSHSLRLGVNRRRLVLLFGLFAHNVRSPAKLYYQLFGLWIELTNRRDEPVSMFWNRLNELLIVRALGQRFSQVGDIPSQSGFFYESARPNPGHQLVLRHQPTLVFDQDHQGVELLRRKPYRVPVPRK